MMSELDLTEFERLHTDCVNALEAYIEAARGTCRLLEAFKQLNPEPEIHPNVLAQRVRENIALEMYLQAREALFAAVGSGSGAR